MNVECPYCLKDVACEIVADKVGGGDVLPEDYKILMLTCPSCGTLLIALQTLVTELKTTSRSDVVKERKFWGDPIVFFPESEERVSYRAPFTIRNAISEAYQCYKRKDYNSCVVKSEIALVALCQEFSINKYIDSALDELFEKGVIDKCLHEWGKVLNCLQIMSVQTNPQSTSKEDAKDMIDFTIAICDYIYTLKKQYDDFMERRNNSA